MINDYGDYSPGDMARAHALHISIVTTKREIEAGYLRLGAYLWEFYKARCWETLAYPTFTAYLGSPEVCLSPRHAWRLIGCAETYLALCGDEAANVLPADQLVRIGVTKADMLRPVIHPTPLTYATVGEIREWAAKAETLSVGDLQREIEALGAGEYDPDGAYWEELSYQLAAVARRLRDPGQDRLDVLDALAARCLEARALCEAKRV